MTTRYYRKLMYFNLSFLLVWLVFAQSCMRMRISDGKAKKEFAKEGVILFTETFQVNGYPIHYAKTGNDSLPTLFFLHGSPGSWDAFSVYMKDEDLLAKYRMIAIDRPGFGYSNFGDSKNLAEQSRIISLFLNHITNGKPIHIIGHSLGGPLAVKLAADNSYVFATMVLLAASVDPSEEPKEKWRGVLFNTPFQYLLPGVFRQSNNEIWMAKKELDSLAKQFASISCDVWIVHGDADTFVPVGNATYAKKMLVNAKSVQTKILSGAPHFIPWSPWYTYIKEILLTIK